MSLINQMLKDLEQRGGFPSDTKFEPAQSKSLGSDQPENKGKYTFLKISGALILMYCAVYLWVKNPTIFKAPHLNATTDVAYNTPNAVIANAPPLPTPPAVAEPQAPVAQVTAEIVKKVDVVTTNVVEKNKVNEHIQNVAPNEIDAKKTKKVSPSPKVEHETVEEKVLTPSDFENIAPATIAPVEIKRTKIASKPMPSTTNNQATEGFSKQESPAQKSVNLYNLALKEFEKGRTHEAEEQLSKAIQANPANEDARQMLAALMVDNKKIPEAKNLLADGLTLNPQQTGFRMAVARLQLESGEKQNALDTLMQGINDARKNADYQSFLAALLQRADRHEEAVTYYNAAIGLQSQNPNALVGLGISLQALGKYEEAQSAFNRALSSNGLNAELTSYVEQRLKQVNQHLKTP